ncbi:alpha/beta fold hydrolase [Aquabacterium soli]|uniref:Alpha/beta fold hydrolase n=1 Tax=Aquabacterium soli TaxID=2493092 RepID=A0A3R8S3Z3_9BURK|nr:alpha/beta fold hydrolase [Aquabacterium soli]RRS04906.1 alpha/beta fold hydrolase [Aquabacterium soli]
MSRPAITEQRIPVGVPTPTGQEPPWLACRLAGPADQPDAPLLVFLHGFPEAAFVWDGLLQHFGQHYRCVAPNLRGYEGSFAPADVSAYKAPQILGDFAGLIQSLGGKAHAVIAHDWGGALAWGLAATAPQLLDKLIILNAPHPGAFLKALRDDPAQQAASSYMNLLRRPEVEARLAADDFAMMWTFFERFGGAGWLTPALRDRYRQAWSAPTASTAGLPAASSALTGPLNYYRASPLHPPTSPSDAIHTLQLPDALLRVNVPTRVIWGEADVALPPSLLEGLEAHVPDLRITRLPGLSHWLVHEDPDTVTRALETALQN